MNFTLANSIILAGIIQGFIFGVVYLLYKKYRSLSTTLLAGLILAFSYNNLQFYLSDARIITGNQMYATFYIPVGSLIPVFIYLYTKSFITGAEKLRAAQKWLFTPFLFFFAVAIALKIDSWNDVNAVRKPIWQLLGKIQSSVSFMYTVALITAAYIWAYKKTKKLEFDNSIMSRDLKWIKIMLPILLLLSLFWGFALLKYMSNLSFKVYFTALWILLSFAIYWLGHIGMYKYGVRKERKSIRDHSTIHQPFSISEKLENPHVLRLEKVLVDNQRFLDSKLTLQQLSDELQISKTHLSRLLNHELGMSFTDYVNSLRVEAAKTNLIHPDFANYTLVAIGLEAGFNSKTTFNSAFKKHTGMTPSQFRTSNKQ